MTMRPPEKLDAQMPDKQGVVGSQLFTSLLRRGGGWFANRALQTPKRVERSRRARSDAPYQRGSSPSSPPVGPGALRRPRLRAAGGTFSTNHLRKAKLNWMKGNRLEKRKRSYTRLKLYRPPFQPAYC